MQEKVIEFTHRARYYQSGNLDKHTRQLWFALHGYGQLARYFVKKFEVLHEHQICVIAPEGLSRFYTEDVEKRAVTGNNRVGATWMTAENRVMDIENYLTYLDAVYLTVTQSFDPIPVTLLGFSQGAATASRWALHTSSPYERLILWAGIFPPDMDFKKANKILSAKSVHLVYGTKDPYLNNQRLQEMTSLNNKLNLHPPVTTFEGGHEIDDKTLLKFV
jgi:predicted esterase